MLRPMVAKLVKIGMTKKGRAMQKILDEKSRDVKAAQHSILKDILEFAKDTVYGRLHEFGAIDSAGAFAGSVPINTYEDLRSYVDRHAAGEANVLFPGKPMFYATTSGTTDKPKLIPITRKYHDECYNGLTKLWFYAMFKQNPNFLDGRDISMVGKAVEGRTEDGTPYGSFSGHMNAYMPEFVKRFRVIPFQVHDIDDYHSKYYALMRIAMGVPIRWIVAANPSTLVELHRFAVAHFDEIVADIRRGTLKADLNISPAIRTAIENRLTPNPKRADALSALQREHAKLLPKHYWPGLSLINTWKCGNSGLYLKQTEGFYPEHTVIREFGYIATEARAGIVLDNDDDASVLAAHLLFFEFIKASDIGSANPRVYLAHELEVGEAYGILVTTPSGLYRYDMNDIIKMEGFYNEFPKIKFVQKGRGVVNLTGEKLSEAQYIAAVDHIQTVLGLKIPFHVAFGDIETSRYHVFVEAESDSARLNLDAISKELDDALARLNMEYTAKRRSNRIKPPAVHPLPSNAYQRYKQQALADGARDGQFKITQISIDEERFQMFKDLSHTPPRSRGDTVETN
ncbi:MAG: GH3 auxin-responsive promoter family protein [Planctomycetia bacterium]|jgi:hypothetical protein